MAHHHNGQNDREHLKNTHPASINGTQLASMKFDEHSLQSISACSTPSMQHAPDAEKAIDND